MKLYSQVRDILNDSKEQLKRVWQKGTERLDAWRRDIKPLLRYYPLLPGGSFLVAAGIVLLSDWYKLACFVLLVGVGAFFLLLVREIAAYRKVFDETFKHVQASVLLQTIRPFDEEHAMEEFVDDAGKKVNMH